MAAQGPASRPERFVVGSGDDRIGVAVRKPGGFEFLSAHDDFAPLHGRVFPRARLLVSEVARQAQRMRGRGPTPAGTPSGGSGLW